MLWKSTSNANQIHYKCISKGLALWIYTTIVFILYFMCIFITCGFILHLRGFSICICSEFSVCVFFYFRGVWTSFCFLLSSFNGCQHLPVDGLQTLQEVQYIWYLRKAPRESPQGPARTSAAGLKKRASVPAPRPTQTPGGHARSQGPSLATPAHRSGARLQCLPFSLDFFELWNSEHDLRCLCKSVSSISSLKL